MLQRYEKGGEKGASVRALAPDFFRLGPVFHPCPVSRPLPVFQSQRSSRTLSVSRHPLRHLLRRPSCRLSRRSFRARLARCVWPCCPISSSAACCPAPSGPFLICSVPTCSAARPLFPLRYVSSRSLFRLRCVRPFLSACRRRPSGPPLSRARRRSSRVAAQTSAHSPVSPFYAFRHPFPAPLCALRSAAAPRNVFSAEKLPDSPGKNAKNHTSRFVTIFDCYFFHIPKSFYTFVPSNSVLRAAARRGAGRRPGPAPQCADDHRTKDLRFY